MELLTIMVNRDGPERRKGAEYGLQLVHRLAAFRQVGYAGERIQGHLQRLGYGLDEACELLRLLGTAEYHESLRYSPRGPWHDVYLLEHPADDEPDQKLYIKFHVSANCVLLTLCSMHPEGWE